MSKDKSSSAPGAPSNLIYWLIIVLLVPIILTQFLLITKVENLNVELISVRHKVNALESTRVKRQSSASPLSPAPGVDCSQCPGYPRRRVKKGYIKVSVSPPNRTSPAYSQQGQTHYALRSGSSTNNVVGRLQAQGPIGPTGEVGLPGYSGLSGMQGSPGLAGQPGSPGMPGLPGEPGFPGYPGDYGQEGSYGSPGESGQPGYPGSPGYPGQPGSPGTPGASGAPGGHSETQSESPYGYSSYWFSYGYPAEQATPPGYQDSTNPDGQGSRRDRSQQSHAQSEINGHASNSRVQGPSGSQGVIGEPGERGSAGGPGRPGLSGSPGRPGLDGASGSRGIPGSPGRPASSRSSSYTGSKASEVESSGSGSQSSRPGYKSLDQVFGWEASRSSQDTQTQNTSSASQSHRMRGDMGDNGWPNGMPTSKEDDRRSYPTRGPPTKAFISSKTTTGPIVEKELIIYRFEIRNFNRTTVAPASGVSTRHLSRPRPTIATTTENPNPNAFDFLTSTKTKDYYPGYREEK